MDTLLRELIQALDPETRNSIALVGGQALSIWGLHYLINELTGEEFAHLSSIDIDFLGRSPEVVRCAAAWHQQPTQPSPFDSTPHTAIFLLDHDLYGQPLFDQGGNRTKITVDFLDHVHGVPDKELLHGMDVIVLDDDYQLRLLTPALCLKSRYHNLHSLPYGPKRLPREIVRARLAANVTRAYLIDLLEHPENLRRALDWSKIVVNLALSHAGIQVSVKYGLEPLDAIPEAHRGFSDDFRNKYFTAMKEKIARKRESYLKRLSSSPEDMS